MYVFFDSTRMPPSDVSCRGEQVERVRVVRLHQTRRTPASPSARYGGRGGTALARSQRSKAGALCAVVGSAGRGLTEERKSRVAARGRRLLPTLATESSRGSGYGIGVGESAGLPQNPGPSSLRPPTVTGACALARAQRAVYVPR